MNYSQQLESNRIIYKLPFNTVNIYTKIDSPEFIYSIEISRWSPYKFIETSIEEFTIEFSLTESFLQQKIAYEITYNEYSTHTYYKKIISVDEQVLLDYWFEFAGYCAKSLKSEVIYEDLK